MEEQNCELTKACMFNNRKIDKLPDSILNSFVEKYCKNCKDACALYMLARETGLNYIPQDMFPNEYGRALDIIADHHQ